MLLNSKKSLKCTMLTLKCFLKMTKRDMTSTRQHLARLLKLPETTVRASFDQI